MSDRSDTVDALLAAAKKCAHACEQQAQGASAGSSQGFAAAAKDLADAAHVIQNLEALRG